MLKAILDLNNSTFVFRHSLDDLVKKWAEVPTIKLWLKARRFDLSLPISVTKDDKANTLTFTQVMRFPSRTIVLVHPNPTILDQLTASLKEEGHIVYPFTKVRMANAQLESMNSFKMPVDKIIIPKNLKIHHDFTYEGYLNQFYPQYQILTIDKKDYRESISLKNK